MFLLARAFFFPPTFLLLWRRNSKSDAPVSPPATKRQRKVVLLRVGTSGLKCVNSRKHGANEMPTNIHLERQRLPVQQLLQMRNSFSGTCCCFFYCFSCFSDAGVQTIAHSLSHRRQIACRCTIFCSGLCPSLVQILSVLFRCRRPYSRPPLAPSPAERRWQATRGF